MSNRKRVFFVRHGQAQHNVRFEKGDRSGAKLLDPELTDLGKKQALDICPNSHPLLKDVDIELIVSSPLKRTIETTCLVFNEKLKQASSSNSVASEKNRETEKKIILHPDVQETGDVKCDTGQPLDNIWPHLEESLGSHIDFKQEIFCTKLLDSNSSWHIKEGDYEHTGEKIKARIIRFSKWLAERPEENIVVVAHHNVFLALLRISFLNCEIREYELDVEKLTKILDQEETTHDIFDFWTPVQPLPVGTNEGLPKPYINHNHSKLKLWGFNIPKAFR